MNLLDQARNVKGQAQSRTEKEWKVLQRTVDEDVYFAKAVKKGCILSAVK